MKRTPKPTTYSCRFTGWQLVYGLRFDLYPFGYESQYVLGCLDATTAMPGGSVTVEEFDTRRFAHEIAILREGI